LKIIIYKRSGWTPDRRIYYHIYDGSRERFILGQVKKGLAPLYFGKREDAVRSFW